ncbi:tRNA1(Val) (adenine(37)-N6)-methyltransferase [Venenivibrio stagnispumantis]|uniref:tRNA1(Val) A37 N6-methylase TrmN6 n=1 Tax=Venenivibrio stagnispumantis TaxID=407998 RepID=A0AA45WKG2_9AQUI|nr:methyltransferase [Venenivibrio stagnispumantis]MCW4573473.1 methyltransferase [Venenivibrio stagnispumantis]SMP06807.1 tRNA1(Val) A37 N6-methylase TrmN6 [Venenivibrio stagnispumantis]
MNLKPDEDISPFIRGKIKIIQKKEGFRFGIDSLLLSDFTKIYSRGKILDIGTGSGIIPILLHLKYPNLEYYAVEIQEELYDIAKRNFEINNVDVKLFLEDVKNIKNIFKAEQFDYIITNPPYYKSGKSKNIQIEIAKIEKKATIKDFIEASSYLLKNKGKLFMINIAERLPEIIFLLKKYRLEPKRLKFIHPSKDEKATHFLVQADKATKEGGCIIENPVIIYENPKVKKYTEEVWNLLENYPL